jgi:hypothetical protein
MAVPTATVFLAPEPFTEKTTCVIGFGAFKSLNARRLCLRKGPVLPIKHKASTR